MQRSTFERTRCSAFENHAVHPGKPKSLCGLQWTDAAEIRAPIAAFQILLPRAALTTHLYHRTTNQITTTTQLLHTTNVPWTIPRLASRTLESPAISGWRKVVTLDVARHVSVGVRQITTDRVSVGDKPRPFATRFRPPVQVRTRTVGCGCRGGHTAVGACGRAVGGGVQVAG